MHSGTLSQLDIDLDDMDLDLDDADDANVEAISLGAKIKVDLADVDIESWRRDLWNDRETLRELLDEMRKITPEHDLKLQELKRIVLAKVAQPINPGNKKVPDLLRLRRHRQLPLPRALASARAGRLDSAIVTGGSHSAKTTLGTGYDFQQVLTLFSPKSKQRHLTMPKETAELDVLIGTDVISEGQNLQDGDFLVNYDIHWNPVRIIQRFGRIDRIGSTNAQIQMVNFWPDISLDEYINLKERVENRMVIADLAGTADDNVLTMESSEAAFRKEQLRKLQDEVIELEDVRTGVSITDLGLNDFRMDLLAYMKDDGDLATAPKGLHAVIPADPSQGTAPRCHLRAAQREGRRAHQPWTTGSTRTTSSTSTTGGNVLADHTEAKHLLDLLRAGCRPYDAPVSDVTRLFNAATSEGAEMGTYSELLSTAIRTMIDVTDEQDVDSLFTDGPTTALTQSIAGLDDFELIAFIAVVDPAEANP
jgi:hypothetical protein